MSKNHAAPGAVAHAEGHNQGGFDTTDNIVLDPNVFFVGGKQRTRAFRAELYDLAALHNPLSAKQLYYLAARVGVVQYGKKGRLQVKQELMEMRLNCDLPYNWISDGSRWNRPTSHENIRAAISDLAENRYRRPIWRDCSNVAVQVWLKKPELEHVIAPVTREFQVPLMVARDAFELSAVFQSSWAARSAGCPCVIYTLGDHDPANGFTEDPHETALERWASLVALNFRRLGVTFEQFQHFELPERKDGRCELESIPPNDLRDIVRNAISSHLDFTVLNDILEREGFDKHVLQDLAAKCDEEVRDEDV